MVEALRTYLVEHGWNIEWNDAPCECLPENVTKRYRNIPEQWLRFTGSIKRMISPDDTTWFLCAEDFAAQSESSFQWNEWERISLESADGDTEWQNEIRTFWDSHLPVIMSVKGRYSYYAITISDGSIVYGSEPEFEECETVAVSFRGFIEKIIKGELKL